MDEEIYFITKEEFRKRMSQFTESLKELYLKYNKLFLKEKSQKKKAWYKKQLDELREDINHNLEMIRRAELEEGYNIYYIDAAGNIALRRCSKEEYEEIYKKGGKACYIA